MEYLNHVLESYPSSEVLLHLVHVYGIHLVLLCLSAMTVYRREMSCNHCYAEPEHYVHKNMEITNAHDDAENDWDDVQTDELLESVGLYCSGASLLPAMLHVLEHWNKQCVRYDEILDDGTANILPIATSSALRPLQKMTKLQQTEGNFFGLLNVDTQVNVLSYLLPQEITTFECASKTCQSMANESAIWKSLWYRDYAWILLDWDVGQRAARRSGCNLPVHFDKEFYTRFQLSWMNFAIAGESTYDSCLVGLGGHVFDLSFFLSSHPGSPETVMVHAGKDATDFFMGVRHSMGARRLAQSFCVVVDSVRLADAEAKHFGFGLHPTAYTTMTGVDPFAARSLTLGTGNLLIPQGAQTLQREQMRYCNEEAVAKEAAIRYNHASVSGEANVYFDPLAKRWKAWYMDRDLQIVYVDQL
ncbi:hypothetical protein MPSEU_000797300 [Mayamaea pseudoterrestris]|nr:hypothetical protein MPSEU_000797300 [Mayamaea pseudoterrestris]